MKRNHQRQAVEEAAGTKRKKLNNMASRSNRLNNLDLNKLPESPRTQDNAQQDGRVWVVPKSCSWWDECNNPDYPEEEFRKKFRMGRATFNMVCEELSPVIAKKNTHLQAATPVNQKVAVCLWKLATGEPLKPLAKRFGLGISTCHKIVLDVCYAIKNILLPKYLRWPDAETSLMMKNEFRLKFGMPNVVGSMHTTHVAILCPDYYDSFYYFNKFQTERTGKATYSVSVNGVVDHQGVFTSVTVGYPGSMPDNEVLQNSDICHRASVGLLGDNWVVGNSRYPLMDWVLVPYTHQNLTRKEHIFNEKIDKIHKVSKDAFSRLKGRWASLQKKCDMKLSDLKVVLEACCVLHNICEIRNEEMDLNLDTKGVDDETVLELPARSISMMAVRNAITNNLLDNPFITGACD